MKVSLDWIKDFVTVRLPIEKLSHRMAMGGLEVVSVEREGQDTLLEIEITPNRPDLLSHIGIAREIAALTHTELKIPESPRLPNPPKGKTLPFEIVIQDKKGCARYIGRLFEGIQFGPSPTWIQARLERLGHRSINNIVDITNYILLEEGQPLHAFDYDLVKGGKIIVRSARKGETLLAIDGETYQLEEKDLVIADTEKPIALAGVMGGKNTEIHENTKRIILESAYFDPVRVRQTSKRLGISTESSYRFERGVSLEGVQRGSDRASSFLMKWAKAKTPSKTLDMGQKRTPTKHITVSFGELYDTLGVSPTLQKTKGLLRALACQVSGTKTLQVTPPYFRSDLQEPVDVTEEVGRLMGYDAIPTTFPLRERTSLEKTTLQNLQYLSERKVKDFLISQGFFEVVTYSLMSRVLLKAFFGEQWDAIAIQNPLSLEQEIMRPSLIPRLVEVAAYNDRRKVESVPIFEIGPLYQKKTHQYYERRTLGILLFGKKHGDWKTPPSAYDYYDVKGQCEALIHRLDASAIPDYKDTALPFLTAPAQGIFLKETQVGSLGQLSHAGTQFFDLKGNVFVAELDLATLFKAIPSSKQYVPLPKHPSVLRDVALIVQDEVPSAQLVETIQTKGGEWIRDISLFDAYSDPRIVPQGSRGLAYRIEFLHPERTLTDQEVNEKYQAILEGLQALGAQVRTS